ncbi:hypothetical protein [Chitinophaga sp. Cy-1792]|uniref:hypothetical protein n=1 Tax=Chitinophaga sp. Cy-1792 TaxID=2608339 RepID=UPI0014216412|nr:hypothetical protein [Chitinophaga sp. Cy-1792]NIG57126.1 hypothetical protein [Chitinophaga sp. Cy-1792]
MKLTYQFLWRCMAGAVLVLAGCRKTDFPEVSSPAYLRVFNCLTYNITIDNKDAPQPFLTMLVDPELDASGIPVGAGIVFDYLDTRGPLARPYPDAGNSALFQKDYPGTAKIPVGPIVNGYDLSGYGMITSGSHRFMFVTRPRSTDPFFSLTAAARKNILVDSTIQLDQGEVYTMNVLERSIYTRKTGIYLRKEIFTKIPLSDSLVYTNFYNLSSEGYAATYSFGELNAQTNVCIRDTMNVFYTLYTANHTPVNGFSNLFTASMIRSQDPVVHPYTNFPLFPVAGGDGIFAGTSGQKFNFLLPGIPPDYAYGNLQESMGMFTSLAVGPEAPIGIFNTMADIQTGMVISIRSGIYNPRSFATVNTVEYVNGNMYITTLQRRYDPPIYK